MLRRSGGQAQHPKEAEWEQGQEMAQPHHNQESGAMPKNVQGRERLGRHSRGAQGCELTTQANGLTKRHTVSKQDSSTSPSAPT